MDIVLIHLSPNMQTRSMTYRAALLQGIESFESYAEFPESTMPPSTEKREIEWDDEPEASSADDFHDAMAEEAYRELMADQARRGARTRVRMQW
jgi:hypothetical protein